jgi:hypothetical protein
MIQHHIHPLAAGLILNPANNVCTLAVGSNCAQFYGGSTLFVGGGANKNPRTSGYRQLNSCQG